MARSIILTEEDLHSMPEELRDQLLKWYFTRRSLPRVGGDEPHELSAELKTRDFVDIGPRRITFAELVRAELLRAGDQIFCKSLKRQQRKGSEEFIQDAVVSANGTVEYGGQRFSNPSKLAIAMVNANGGKAKALNGYDYLFVQTTAGPRSLAELREFLLEGTPAEKAMVQTLLEETPNSFGGDRYEALDWVRKNPGLSHRK